MVALEYFIERATPYDDTISSRSQRTFQSLMASNIELQEQFYKQAKEKEDWVKSSLENEGNNIKYILDDNSKKYPSAANKAELRLIFVGPQKIPTIEINIF